jgi:hypothetical protein
MSVLARDRSVSKLEFYHIKYLKAPSESEVLFLCQKSKDMKIWN